MLISIIHVSTFNIVLYKKGRYTKIGLSYREKLGRAMGS